MIDDLKMELACFLLDDERLKEPHPFLAGQTTFSPVYNSTGECYLYKAYLRNLYLKLYPGRLVVENSIHKYFKSNNYSDFPMQEVLDCLFQLADVFGEAFWSARITRLTTSINLHCDAPMYLECLMTYKGLPMDLMRPRKSRKVYGKKFSATKYTIKVYDKAMCELIENDLNIDPTLRIENEMHLSYVKKRANNPIVINTPKDFFELSVQQSLEKELTDLLDNLGFLSGLDALEASSFCDAQIIMTMSEEKGRMVLKKKADQRTKKRYEERYQTLTSEFWGVNIHQELKIILKQKLEQLMAIN